MTILKTMMRRSNWEFDIYSAKDKQLWIKVETRQSDWSLVNLTYVEDQKSKN